MPQTPEPMLKGQVAPSTMRQDLASNRFDETSADEGPQRYALSIATVAWVDYEKMEVSLRTDSGTLDTKVPVPISFPGAGSRHFLGAMPEPGDKCIIGWGMAESGRSRVPWILAWLIPGVTAGYDWLPTQPYTPDEAGSPPKLRSQMEGVYDRKRHKLRHLEPGHVVASSSQGADLVLNESALLSNRRGNEVHLRDQDQAIVFRSLQQFHAGAGFRSYSGMVQRDATLLPTQMFSDGTDWASSRQVDASGNPIPQNALRESPHGNGLLTPDGVFQRLIDNLPLNNNPLFQVHVDPYEFLQGGLFIGDDGFVRGNAQGQAIYGGKPLYRVSSLGTNGVTDTSAGTFTEIRWEVSHLSDGTLPVTEQTDGLDADRLCSSNPDEANPLTESMNAPFMEFVLGTVVGNDPYTVKGRDVYGLPLRPVVQGSSPGLVSGIGSPVGEHAAFLLKIHPPVGLNPPPSFLSFTKDGRFLASIQGPLKSWSSEIRMGAGMYLGMGGGPGGQSLQLDLAGCATLQARKGRNSDNVGVDISSETGAVRIFAGGQSQVGGTMSRATTPGTVGDSSLPGLILESGSNILVKATQTITLSANALNLVNVGAIRLGAMSSLDFQSGSGISHSSNTYVQSSTGKSTYNYSGPKDGLGTNGPLRETSFTGTPGTGFPGGTADKYEMVYGDRTETITTGNHTTTILVGNQTYRSVAGKVSLESGPTTSLELSPLEIKGQSPLISFRAVPGAITLQASLGTLSADALFINADVVSFTSDVPGTHTPPGGVPGGGVLTDGVLDPITGLPFSANGILGVPGIRVF